MFGFYTMSHAALCATLVLRDCRIPAAAYVFGGIARRGFGRDIDLLFEIPVPRMGQYLAEIGGRIHPQMKGVYNKRAITWDYFAPEEIRAIATLSALRCVPTTWDGLRKVAPGKKVDMICVPADWRVHGGTTRTMLDESVRDRDPKFFANLEETAVPLGHR